MTTELQTDVLQDLLEELCGWDAMEVITQEGKETEAVVCKDSLKGQKCHKVLIPYVMNDAVECYLELTGATIQGNWDPEFEGDVTLSLTEREDGRKGLFLYQEDQVTSIWFDKAYRHLNCFQYHNIGHMWRKDPGEEEIRQLVHLICVARDKWNYLGEEACTEEEQRLSALAEFPPFRYWTPINESILEWYKDSIEGIDAFLNLLSELEKQCGNRQTSREGTRIRETRAKDSLRKEVLRYREAALQGRATQRQMLSIAKKLAQPELSEFFILLRSRITEASCHWPPRIYAQPEQEKVEQLRKKAADTFTEKGYTGTYPLFENASEWVHFLEEQPFTVMESDEYEFIIMELHIAKVAEGRSWLSGKAKQQTFMKRYHE